MRRIARLPSVTRRRWDPSTIGVHIARERRARRRCKERQGSEERSETSDEAVRSHHEVREVRPESGEEMQGRVTRPGIEPGTYGLKVRCSTS